MHQSDYQCAACGAALGSPEAICSRCDAELSTTLPRPFRCPSCAGQIDEAPLFPYPAEKPWYWPKRLHPRCPDCRTWLRDRRILPGSDWRILVFIASVLLIAALPLVLWLKMLLIVLAQLGLTYVQRQNSRQIPDSARYAVLMPRRNKV